MGNSNIFEKKIKIVNLNEIIVAIRIKEKNFPLIQKELFVIFFEFLGKTSFLNS